MYRGIIQHAGFLTHYLIANIEARKLAPPLDCGRIWRVVPETAARPASVKIPAAASERAALLGHTNGWVRDTAQRLLVESGDPGAAKEVKARLLLAKTDAIARLHALWTLDGLAALTPEIMQAVFKDADARGRAAAVRMAGREFAPDLIAMTGESDTLVRAHLAIKLGALAPPVGNVIAHAAAGHIPHHTVRWPQGAILTDRRTKCRTTPPVGAGKGTLTICQVPSSASTVVLVPSCQVARVALNCGV